MNINWFVKHKIITAILIISALAIIGKIVGPPMPTTSTNSTSNTVQISVSPNIEPTSVPTVETAGGLGVTRSAIMTAVTRVDPTATFVKMDPIKGLETYGAVSDSNRVVLVGPEQDLQAISVAAVANGSETDTRDALKYLAGFGAAIDQSSEAWINSSFADALTA